MGVLVSIRLCSYHSSLTMATKKKLNPLDVTWSERYNETFEHYWSKLPKFVATFLATFAILVFGSAIHGEWLVFLVNFAKYLQRDGAQTASNSTDESINESSTSIEDLFTLKYYRLEGLGYFLFPAMAISYLTYFGFG